MKLFCSYRPKKMADPSSLQQKYEPSKNFKPLYFDSANTRSIGSNDKLEAIRTVFIITVIKMVQV